MQNPIHSESGKSILISISPGRQSAIQNFLLQSQSTIDDRLNSENKTSMHVVCLSNFRYFVLYG